MNVLVTGGTGILGRHVVTGLGQSGHRIRILSRHPGASVDAVQGDLRTGAGIREAVAGMDAVVHCATGVRESLTSRNVDVKGTGRLLAAAREAGTKHFVFISIVGIEGVAFPYYRTKLEAEALVRQGVVPWSILRATQFHELMEFYLGALSLLPGVTPVPFRWRFQPVDPKEVAQRLVEVVLAQPGGQLEDFGGPEIHDFKSIAESWLAARKQSRKLVKLWLPFRFSRQFSEGHLTTPDHKNGKITFAAYLADKYAQPSTQYCK
jgi:uncharacterized protein YbjT (DUF2867 family)